MTAPMQVGIIGAGAWAAGAHVPAFLACDGVRIAAICDHDLARAAALSATIEGATPYDAIEAMLAAEWLDAVSIVTPTDAHASAANLCLAAGLHVLCEKPLGRTLDQARHMAAQASAAPVITGMGFTMRYAPAIRYLEELVREGALGRVTLLQMFLQNAQFLDAEKPLHWKMTREYAGAGAVVEYGVHGIDLARWMLGPVNRVCATGRTHVPYRKLGGMTMAVDVEDSCGWMMEFADGAFGLCHAGWTTIGRAPGLELRIYGTEAAAQVMLSDDLPASERLCMATAAGGHFEPVAVPARLATALPPTDTWRHRFHQALTANFVARVRGGVDPGPTFSDGVRAQEVLEAVITSMDEDRWVSLVN